MQRGNMRNQDADHLCKFYVVAVVSLVGLLRSQAYLWRADFQYEILTAALRRARLAPFNALLKR
jgi:hypothetical protein